jgi:plastocyanin
LQPAAEPTGPHASPSTGPGAHATAGVSAARLVDPREDGLEIDLGEWALVAEALVIRPGPVTFVVRNRGAHAHGLEIESEDRRDESGGRRDRNERFKHETRVLQPGESVRLTLDLPPGLYKLECLVDGHDDLGMEELFEVRADAPLVEEPPAEGGNAVRIRGFAFEPATITVSAGETVTWTNEESADHTVTHGAGRFGSETLGQGSSFRFRFDRPGTYEYVCALHPEMTGTVVVR